MSLKLPVMRRMQDRHCGYLDTNGDAIGRISPKIMCLDLQESTPRCLWEILVTDTMPCP